MIRRLLLGLVGALSVVVFAASPGFAPPGDLDPTFDGDGKVTTDFVGGFDQAWAMAIQGDGKIVTAGVAFVAGNNDFALARYNTDGSLDTTFDGDGKATTDFAGGDDRAFAVAIQGDGKIVTAGVAFVAGNNDFALARYNTDGSLDTTFSGDGKVTADFAGDDDQVDSADDDQVNAVAIQGDGKIVAAGVAGSAPPFYGGTDPDFALARISIDGNLDTTFDTDGKVTTDFALAFDQVNAVTIQGDGRIVAAGTAVVSFASGISDFALARYNTDGSRDTTFSGDGKVTTDFGASPDAARGVAVQADGKIVAAGRAAVAGTGIDFGLARYNTDGSLDTSFDGDGKVTTDFAFDPGQGDDNAFAMAIQANGKIVAAGHATPVSGTQDFALARYNTDGSLDTTFSGDGKVTTDFAGGTDQAHGVAIQANGRIVAAGVAGPDFALARYTCLRRTSRPMSIPICP